MHFPLNKKIKLNNSETEFLSSFKEYTEIPILPHPGAFAKKRKFHCHEGVDLYCEENDEVLAIENGIVIDIFPFTGEQVGTSWWNNTWGIMIKGNNYSFNYGELIPESNLKIGDIVKEGQVIGKVTTVLKKNKGRPMTMLHLEMYTNDTEKAIKGWDLNLEKPKELLDPTDLLMSLANKK